MSYPYRQRAARPHAVIIANADGDAQPKRQSVSDA